MAYWELKIASMSKTVFFKFILLSVLFVGCSQPESLPFYNSPDFKPLFLRAQNTEKEVPHTIASFAFKNQLGQIIGTKDVLGKIHIANFMFTQCGSICPTMTNNLKRLEERFMEQKGVVMLSYSVTPWIDSVTKLKSYTQDYEITKKEWHFLTGKTSDIYTLARKSYFAEEDFRKLDYEQMFVRKKIDEVVREMQQLENNLGFFSNAKADNPLVLNVRNRVNEFKEDLLLWKLKLSYIKKLDY